MPRLSTSVRIAATSLLLLSLVHIGFWIAVGALIGYFGLNESQFAILHIAIYIIAAAGCAGVAVAVGIFKARNWARIATIALGALTAFACALALIVLFILIATPNAFGFFQNLAEQNRGNFMWMALIYLFVFLLSIWWIVLFSKARIAEQFSDNASVGVKASSNKPKCPPPIALLAWLMIATSALSAISWPLILGRIPAMLFTHIFSAQPSQWIWGANTVLFVACGIGLLKLQRWSYSGTIILHVFWLLSLFVTQLSPLYGRYLSICLSVLSPPDTFISLGTDPLPQWASALFSAIPTALLIIGLFYYRPAFVRAVADSHRLPS